MSKPQFGFESEGIELVEYFADQVKGRTCKQMSIALLESNMATNTNTRQSSSRALVSVA